MSLICKWGKKKRKKQVGRFMVEDNGPEHCYQFRRKKGWTAQTLIDDRKLPKYKDFIRPDLEEIVEKYTPQAKKNVEVCYTCDRWIPTQRRCSECGCFMDVKDIVWKLFAINEGSPCPLNKW